MNIPGESAPRLKRDVVTVKNSQEGGKMEPGDSVLPSPKRPGTSSFIPPPNSRFYHREKRATTGDEIIQVRTAGVSGQD